MWLGTTAGLQETADKNIPELLKCEGMSKLLWVSAEPLLGPVTFHPWIGRLQWIITGGESGNGARPCDPQWVRDIRDECKAAGVAFHHKQWGEFIAGAEGQDTVRFDRVGKKAAGRTLDGKVWDEFPTVAHQ